MTNVGDLLIQMQRRGKLDKSKYDTSNLSVLEKIVGKFAGSGEHIGSVIPTKGGRLLLNMDF